MNKWIITRDTINARDFGLAALTAPGRGEVGSSSVGNVATGERLKSQANSLDHEFRLLDGDDEVYFEGRCSEPDVSADPFAPLDVVGTAYGCVTLEYRKVGATDWVQL